MPYIDFSARAKGLVRERAKHLLAAVTTDLRDEIVLQMDPGPPRTGKTYLVPETKVPYRASAPGEPPAIREGIYAASWQVSPVVERGSRLVGAATNSRKTENGEHFIGELLEYGTQRIGSPGADGSIVPMVDAIAPRPHIRPAMMIVADRWNGVLRERRSA